VEEGGEAQPSLSGRERGMRREGKRKGKETRKKGVW